MSSGFARQRPVRTSTWSRSPRRAGRHETGLEPIRAAKTSPSAENATQYSAKIRPCPTAQGSEVAVKFCCRRRPPRPAVPTMRGRPTMPATTRRALRRPTLDHGFPPATSSTRPSPTARCAAPPTRRPMNKHVNGDPAIFMRSKHRASTGRVTAHLMPATAGTSPTIAKETYTQPLAWLTLSARFVASSSALPVGMTAIRLACDIWHIRSNV